MVRTILIAMALVWALLPAELSGQDAQNARSAVADSVRIVPGPGYQAGWLHAVMGGPGYRDLWTTPLMVEVADLSKLGAGLTPLRVGGGMTTKTLHVKGANGKRYVIRSVNKYPGQGLHEELRGTPIESILQDQISSFHPWGALVVAPLLKAAGVLHVEPRLMVLPDDPRLGKFRDEFAGMLVLFEERPDEGPGDTPGFASSRKIVGSERLFELLEQDPRHRVDARDFLTARLVDLYVGDRDRSVNNWWWARFDDGDRYIWRPIPRDRDQAFIRIDGALVWILRFYEPRFVSFSQDYSSIVGLTRNAWDLDRRLLVSLDKPTWDSVVTTLQKKLTDSVIDDAVRHLPPEHYRLEGAALAHMLRVRRDRLPQAADRFYRIVSEFADIQATDQAELAVVDRLDDEHVEVRLYRRGDDNGELQQSLYFRRTFNRRETREIRLYLYGGTDRAVVRGAVRRSIKVRIVGGGGADELIDSSRVQGRRTYFYDAGKKTRYLRGPSTVVIRRRVPRPVAWQDKAVTPNWGHTWRPAPQLTIDRDLGLFIAPGATHYRYGFLKKPYSSRMQLSAGYATGVGQFVLDYRHDFRDVVRRVHPSFHVRWSGIEILHFHGFGNEIEAPETRNFYKVEQKQLLLAPSVTFLGGGALEFGMGPVLKVSSTDTSSDTRSFLAATRPYGSGSFSQLGAQAAFRIDTRDRLVAATQGFFLTAGGSYYPALLDVDGGAFGEIHGEASTYLSPSKSGDHTLAFRVGAKKVWGSVPFHEAAFVGGAKTVRGFREQRYAGNGAVYGNVEVRTFLSKFFFIFPSDIGVFGLTDVGRVFQDGETSGRWHSSVGGGIWIAPVERSNTIRIGVAKSAERIGFYIGTGFLF
ncbi:MAG: BamA/TamA family outer membrane protein [Bacteroidota bacterium]